MPAFRTLDDADLAGKRVLVRVDLNVPMEEGRVTDTTRIDRVLPTIREIAQKGARSSCSRISAGRRGATRRTASDRSCPPWRTRSGSR